MKIALNIYKALALILGYGLIIACFIIFGALLETETLVLDIIVSCLIFTQFTALLFFPLIDRRDPSHKEVGMMGIHFTANTLCIIASIALMVAGIILEIPFVYQLLGQLLILFFAVIGRITTISAGNKVANVHARENAVKLGKESLRMETDNFMDYVATVKGLEPSVTGRLQVVQESIRYVTPSVSPEALMLDNQFIDVLSELKILMRDTAMNGERIAEEVTRMERTLERRKKY